MKLLIADDHALFRAGIRHVLLQLADSVEIVEAHDHAEVCEQLAAHRDLTLLLLDLGMPGMSGPASIDSLTTRYPTVPVVVLSASENPSDMQVALSNGALGFIPKASTPAVMVGALRLVLAGGIYIPPAMVRIKAPAVREVIDVNPELTSRQSAVLAGVLEGKSNKSIATELGLTEATVKAHVTAVFRALKVTNRTQAAIAAGKINSRSA